MRPQLATVRHGPGEHGTVQGEQRREQARGAPGQDAHVGQSRANGTAWPRRAVGSWARPPLCSCTPAGSACLGRLLERA